jgi:dihydrofolate synthase/folylpolyglutamate synthase
MARDYDVALGLESISQLCELLGNPQDAFKSIHIAGTNGKGSVGAYLESILMEEGYTVGRYTSPAVESLYETVTVDGVRISEEDYLDCRRRVLEASERLVGVREPSQFEVETATAFEYLSTRCDVALVEVGMGGRLDATNVLHHKVLSVLTSISFDHTQYLGDTLEAIASEKCGIVQSGVPTVTVSQSEPAMQTVRSVCQSVGSSLSVADTRDVRNVSLTEGYTLTFDYRDYVGLRTSMLGDFQTDNAALAVVASEVLGLSRRSVVDGIRNARWRYRFEVVRTDPLTVLDGCHNADASRRIRRSVDAYFPGKSVAYVLGVFKDKDYGAIARNLCDGAEVVYTVSTDGRRSLSAEALADVVRAYNPNVVPCETLERAVELSRERPCDVTVVLGSLSTLSEVRKALGA